MWAERWNDDPKPFLWPKTTDNIITRSTEAEPPSPTNQIRDTPLGVHRGEVVLEDAGWGCPAECSVGSVVIVEMHEPGVGAGPLGF